MPIPFLLAGAAALAGLAGVAKGVEATNNNNLAKSYIAEAEESYNSAKSSLQIKSQG